MKGGAEFFSLAMLIEMLITEKREKETVQKLTENGKWGKKSCAQGGKQVKNGSTLNSKICV